MTDNTKYLYGVIPAGAARDFGPIGLRGGDVHTVCEGGLGVVASIAPRTAFAREAPETTLQCLAQHQRVLERVMLDSPVIPLKFGTYADDDRHICRILRDGRNELDAALAKHADKVETDLAARWMNLASVLSEIAADPVVLSAKAALGDPAHATTAQRIRLGQLVKDLLDRRNKAVADRLLATLREIWPNIVVNPARDDGAVLNAAVLIDRRQQVQFDQIIEQLDRSCDGRLNFRRVGPLPPYSFATADVKTLPAGSLDAARQTLDLAESASLAEIKAAHRRLLHEVHPDRCSDPRAADRLADISAAYDLLEEYALNFRHAFGGSVETPVIVTVRSLEDLRSAVALGNGGRAPLRQDKVAAHAA